MKILHTEASRGWGGQEIRILNETAGMMQRGHAVKIACTPGSNIAREARARGIEVVELALEKPSFSAALALRRQLRAEPVDIINTHSSADSWLAAAATRYWRGRPKIVRTRHISAPVAKHWLARWLYQNATDHIVTTGERLRQTLISDNGIDAAHVTSIPTGVDTGYFAPGDQARARAALGLPQSGLIIGIVATLRSWKGHACLLDAFAGLGRDDVHLLIVGDGPQRENLTQRIDQLGLQRRVSLPGNQADVRPWLQAMDIFTLPSWANEGVPQGIMQAMACELPVVSTPVGSIDELVVDGETGLMTEPKNATALAAALSRLLEDKNLRRQLGRAARQRVEQQFTDTVMLDRMEAVFEKTVDSDW